MLQVLIKNCDGKMVNYNFKTLIEFVFKMDTIGYENEIPMLDDEVVLVNINGEKLNDINDINDLYNNIIKKIN